MRKFIFVLFAGLALLSLSLQSCSKDGDDDDQSMNEEEYIAPKNITGLTFTYGDNRVPFVFGSNSFTPKYNQTSGWTRVVIGTPSYTYERISVNKAKLHTNLKSKSSQISGSNWFTLELTYDYVLTFTSEYDGVLSGIRKTSTVSSNLPISNETDQVNNEYFTLQ